MTQMLNSQITDEGQLTQAIIYLRVSTKEQAYAGGETEGYSIPAQREICRKKSEQLGAIIAEEFVDRGESAKTSDRPELKRMLAYICENSISYLIVHKVDRLARNRADDVQIHMALKHSGVTLVSCSENIDETPSGMLLHGIMSSIAEFYSRNLANEVIKGSVQKAKDGGTVGKAPTGYKNVRTIINGREARTVKLDEERAPLMKFAFEAYATGEWTIRKLLSEVTKRGLTTIPGPKTPAKPLAVSHFHRLLQHPYYKGVVRYRGIEYPGKHEPLVSETTWDKVQEVLSQKSLSGEKRRTHHHYLKGTVFCGSCGSRLIVSLTKNRHGSIYPYFICLGRQQRRTNCKQSAILIEDVETLVEKHYCYIQPTDELLLDLKSLILEELKAQEDNSQIEIDRQNNRIKNLLDERRRLLEAHYADAIPIDLLKSEQRRISGELKAADDQIKTIDVGFDLVKTNLSKAIEFASNWKDAYVSAGSTIRRQLNQAIFKKIFIDNTGHLSSELNEPFGVLLSDEVTLASEVKAYSQFDPTNQEFDNFWRGILDSRIKRANEYGISNNLTFTDLDFAQLCQGLKNDTLVDRKYL